MIASLPMYDRPETLAAHDGLWAGLRDALRAEGVAAPAQLDRDIAIWDGWRAQDLLLGQICGLPLRAVMHDRVQLVCTLDYGLPDTPPGYYRSAIVVRRDAALESNARLAINDPLSHSGWGAAHRWAESRAEAFREIVVTGAHAQSARAVADGAADKAFIDEITWRDMQRFEPALTARLTVLDRSDAAPGLALITAPGNDVAGLRRAVRAGVAGLAPAHREALGLRGVVDIPLSDYLSVPVPPSPDIAITSDFGAYRPNRQEGCRP